jgi:FAD-dependent urate hydroxylase
MASSDTPKRGVIIGCGIVGPVVAMFLRRTGIEPVICEGRDGGRDEAGSFLGLVHNGGDVLVTLGIHEQIGALGKPTPKIAFHNHKASSPGETPYAVRVAPERLAS